MKLAPMTTARLAFAAPAMMARLSASERSMCTCGRSAPGMGSFTGSAPVASNSLSKPSVEPSPSVTVLPFGSSAATSVASLKVMRLSAYQSSPRSGTQSSGALPAR